MKSTLNRRLEHLGWPGIVGLGLVIAVAGFYISVLGPQQTHLDEVRDELARARHDIASSDAPETPHDPRSAFYESLPVPRRLPAVLRDVFEAAGNQSLALKHGEYRLAPSHSGKVLQYQVTLPVRGTYPQIRRFLVEAMRKNRALSLQSIRFEREKIDDLNVEAKIRLDIFVAEQP
jgi:hypothetical protein